MQRLKIDFLKFTGAKRFTAKDGTEFVAIPLEANSIYIGAKTLSSDITLMDNRDGPGQYGDDGFAVLGLSKERREAGEKGPIIGNWKHVGQPLGIRSPEYGKPEVKAAVVEDADEIPF